MTTLNLALCQSGALAGGLSINTEHLQSLAQSAFDKGADLVVFPQMALFGNAQDHLQKDISEPMRTSLGRLSKHKGAILVGYAHKDAYGTFNSIALLKDGHQRGFYHKQTLNRDEMRYFDAGRNWIVFDYKGHKLGVLHLEDLDKGAPVLKEAGADLILVMGAHAFCVGEYDALETNLIQTAKTYGLNLAYCNAVGGQDSKVFDGGSLVVDAKGNICASLTRFLEETLIAKYDGKGFLSTQTKVAPLGFLAQMYQALVVGLRDYVEHSGFGGVIVGLSGGIDSALVLHLAVDAFGADKVFAVMMPYEYTSQTSVDDARALAQNLGVSFTVCPIHAEVDSFMRTLSGLFDGQGKDVVLQNIQARVRGNILMALSNQYGHMVINTSNKSESAVGYSTLYGDMVGGFGAIKDVYKTDVYALARYRNDLTQSTGSPPAIPERILTRAPSAELAAGQLDQDALPPYEVLDAILRGHIEEGKSAQTLAQSFDLETVDQVLNLVKKAAHKRAMAPLGVDIYPRSFGTNYRLPIVDAWQD